MTITYIFQILEAVVKGDAEKYGVIPDMNGELQKAVRRSRRRIARLRERAQYELGEMDKAKVAAANDNMRRFTKSLGKIRNLNLEDCRGLIGIEDFLEDGNRIHEVMEMAEDRAYVGGQLYGVHAHVSRIRRVGNIYGCGTH